MGTRYFVVKEQAVPEVLLKVVEDRKAARQRTGAHSTERGGQTRWGISRSSFYKYKDDIFQFHDNAQGKDDHADFSDGGCAWAVIGCAEDHCRVWSEYFNNPSKYSHKWDRFLNLSIQELPTTGNVSEMLEAMEQQKGVRNVKILAKE